MILGKQKITTSRYHLTPAKILNQAILKKIIMSMDQNIYGSEYRSFCLEVGKMSLQSIMWKGKSLYTSSPYVGT